MKNKKSSALGGAISTSVVLFFLLLIAPMPREVRQILAALLPAGWLLAGTYWLVRRFGAKALVTIVLLVLAISGAVGYAYWQDEPNRRLVDQIKQLGAYYVGTAGGTLIVGKVNYVYFDETASDDQVKQFTELDGLEGLERLVIKGTRITDRTARRFSRFAKLYSLYIEGSEVSEETLDQLELVLPQCRFEIK